MGNYDWSKFTEKVAVKAGVKEMYDNWVTAENLEKWFLKRADYYSPDGAKKDKCEACEAGDTYEWEWYGYDFTEKGKVLEANGKDLFKFTFAGDCIVTVSFNEFEEYTIIELIQENIPTGDEHKMKTYRGCSLGWAFFLVNIRSLAEGGIDLRNKDPKIQPMVNN